MKLLALLLLALTLSAQRADSLLQSAMKKESVDGNLPAAIADYKKALAAAKSDRALAAKALYGLAQCYRKQGDSQARAALERIVREFADQPLAAQARAQLDSLAAPSSTSLRKILDNQAYGCANVSADGRLMACALNYVDELAVVDVATGQPRILTAIRKESPANRYFNTFAISPDGKWIVAQIYRAGGVFSELVVVPTNGTGALKTIYKHPEGLWLDVHAWTPDNRSVLFSLVQGPAGSKVPLMSIPLAGGEARKLRDLPDRLQWEFTAYSPDGKWLALRNGKALEIWSAAGEPSATLPDLGPRPAIAGWTPDSHSLLVYTGANGKVSLFQLPVLDGKIAGAPKSLQPAIDEIGRSLGIDAKGSLFLNRFHQTNQSVAISFNPAAASLSGAESPLPRTHTVWSPDGRATASWNRDGQVFVRALPSGPETIATPEKPFSPHALAVWTPDSKALFGITSAERGSAHLSRLDPATGKITPASAAVALRNAFVPPAWSPDGRTLYLADSSRKLVRIDSQSGAATPILDFPKAETGIRAFTVSPDGAQLAWFGSTRIMRGDGEWTGTTNRWIHVLDLATAKLRDIEIPISPAFGPGVLTWTPDSRHLVFSAQQKDTPNLWVAAADGSAPPRAISPAAEGVINQLAFSPDGKTLSYTRTTRHEDIWALSNFLGGGK